MTKTVARRSDVVARRSDGTGGTGVASNDRERHPRRVRRRGGSDGHRAGTATRNPTACPLPMRAGPAQGTPATGGTQDGRVAPQRERVKWGDLGVARILQQLPNSVTSDRHKQLGGCFF